MTKFIDEYRKRVKKRLSRHEKLPALEVAEALCMPSFHPETLLAEKARKLSEQIEKRHPR
jgi:hypothetical protein